MTQEQYNKLMCLLNTQPDHKNDKEPSMAASVHLEGKLCLNFLNHSRWILDSGASDQIYCDISLFKKHDVLKGKQNTIIIPDGAQVRVKFIGTVWLNNALKLNRVLYVPDFKYNLISVHKLCLDRNIKIIFVANMCVMQETLKKPLLLGKLKNNLYFVEERLVPIANGDLLNIWNTY